MTTRSILRLLLACALLGSTICSAQAQVLTAFNDPALRAREQVQLQSALDHLAPQRPGQPDLYAIGFAGDNTEDVFRNEAVYFKTLMSERFGARGRVLTLINHNNSLIRAPQPLATQENLRTALKSISKKMDHNEDILLLFMTMHGTRDHRLYVQMAPMYLDLISPDTLRAALDDAGIRNRVLVISACYSGGFIPALKNNETLIFTAAHSSRPSFGCGPDSDATYFGRAFMIEALNETTDFVAAFDKAKISITSREKKQRRRPSYPQINIGANILTRLQAWRAQLIPGPAVPFLPEASSALNTPARGRRNGNDK